jgi:hypothetical protein
MAEMAHYCSACGEVHGAGSRESEEVKIAKINAERDIEVAKLSRAESREYTEANVEQAAIEAEAAVEQTAIQAEAIVEVGAVPGEEPETPVVEAPVIVQAPEPEGESVAAPPETEPASSGKETAGWWGGYS